MLVKALSVAEKSVCLPDPLLLLNLYLPPTLFGADGDYGKEAETAVSQFKQELTELTEGKGVSSELQRLIDALVKAEWKRPSALPEVSLEELEELVSAIYDAFHPLQPGSEQEDHVRSLQTALKRLGFYAGKIDGVYGNGTRRSVQAAQHELSLSASGEVDDKTAKAITRLLRKAESGVRWKLPRKDDPEVFVPEDQMALYREIMEENGIPPYFAEALAEQEAGSDHFDSDGFVKMRCEFWSQYPHDEKAVLFTSRSVHKDFEIRYRSFGLMQILDMGHPEDDYSRGEEVGNITNRELRCSVEKNIEAGAHLLRSLLTGKECIYDKDDERHYQCKACIGAIETVERDWTKTRFHKWHSYVAMLKFADWKSGRCYPSQRTLADICDYNRTYVNEKIKELIDNGLIRKESDRKSAPIYHIIAYEEHLVDHSLQGVDYSRQGVSTIAELWLQSIRFCFLSLDWAKS